MGLHPCQCPVCMANFMGQTPGAPCSSGCAAKLAQDRMRGQGISSKAYDSRTGEHVSGTGSGWPKGKKFPDPAPKKGGNCLVLAVALAAGAAGLVAGAAEVVRHIV